MKAEKLGKGVVLVSSQNQTHNLSWEQVKKDMLVGDWAICRGSH